MAYVTIPKDLSKVKNKVFLNLTKRQLICMGFAASIGVRFKRPAVRRYEIENLYEYEPEKPVTPKVKKEGIIGKRKG